VPAEPELLARHDAFYETIIQRGTGLWGSYLSRLVFGSTGLPSLGGDQSDVTLVDDVSWGQQERSEQLGQGISSFVTRPHG